VAHGGAFAQAGSLFQMEFSRRGGRAYFQGLARQKVKEGPAGIAARVWRQGKKSSGENHRN